MKGNYLIDVANWLVDEISLTINAHNDQWDSVNDVYRFRDTGILGHPDEILPYNQYAAMGRTLLMMYLATGNSEYLQKVTGMANHFTDALNYDNSTNTYTWGYSLWDSTEDISHAAIEVNFAYLCYHNGVVFDELDMNRFANTFIKYIYLNPLEFSDNVNGTGDVNTYMYQTGSLVSDISI